MKRLIKGDLHSFLVNGYANHLITRWERFNKKYYYPLKHELYEELNAHLQKLTDLFKHRRAWN